MTAPSRILAALLLLMSLSACGTSASACEDEERLCIGLVTSTAGLDDHGLNASAWEGLQRAVQENSGWKVDYIESVDSRDYGKNLAAFASQGYDVVIGSGAGQQDAVLAAANEYPGTRFLGLDQQAQAKPPSNLAVVTFPEEQGGFLAGALAAMISHTGIIGAVCETSGLDPMWRYCEGFRLGAQYEKKDITVLVTYHESASPDTLFTDEDWGARTAGSMLHLGADVIFGVGGRLGQGALRRAAQAGAWSIGSGEDQYYGTPEARRGLLSSAIPDASGAVLEAAHLAASEGWPAQIQGTMQLAPWHDEAENVPLSAQAALQALLVSLQNGSLPVYVIQPG